MVFTIKNRDLDNQVGCGQDFLIIQLILLLTFEDDQGQKLSGSRFLSDFVQGPYGIIIIQVKLTEFSRSIIGMI